MQTHTLNAELREEKGNNACNRLRSNGYIPAVMYCHGKSEPLKILNKDFSHLFKGHISESVIIDINITNKTEDAQNQVFIKDYQLDPVTDEVLHIDFYKITLGEKIHTKVPVELVGTSKGVRLGGILEFVERELEIECLPKELPGKIQIDVSELEIGQSLHISDLKAEGSVRFLSDLERVIVTILSPSRVEEKAPVEAAAEAETEEKEPEAQEEAQEKEKEKEKGKGKGKE